MCIIIAKKKGVEFPKLETLKNCWSYNRDGAGFSYNKNGEIIIEKGFMTFENLIKRFKELKKEIDVKDTSILIHFRISTSGKVDEGNCHPFPITTELNDLRKKKLSCKCAMAHNGIISEYNGIDKTFSDTALFISKWVAPMFENDNDFYKDKPTKEMLEKMVNGSRLAFITSEGEISLVGNWKKKEGLYFSNGTYKKQTINYRKFYFDSSFFNIKEESDIEEYFVDGVFVTKDEFDLMLMTLTPLDRGESVISKDCLDEFKGDDGCYYVDEDDKIIYELSNDNELNEIGEFYSKEDL